MEALEAEQEGGAEKLQLEQHDIEMQEEQDERNLIGLPMPNQILLEQGESEGLAKQARQECELAQQFSAFINLKAEGPAPEGTDSPTTEEWPQEHWLQTGLDKVPKGFLPNSEIEARNRIGFFLMSARTYLGVRRALISSWLPRRHLWRLKNPAYNKKFGELLPPLAPRKEIGARVTN